MRERAVTHGIDAPDREGVESQPLGANVQVRFRRELNLERTE
jgi:hypothetical protein